MLVRKFIFFFVSPLSQVSFILVALSLSRFLYSLHSLLSSSPFSSSHSSLPFPSHLFPASQRAPECLPLVMEPRSQLYTDPVVVLDFQSLYPSIIIAYNMCYSTCLGKVGFFSAFPHPQIHLSHTLLIHTHTHTHYLSPPPSLSLSSPCNIPLLSYLFFMPIPIPSLSPPHQPLRSSRDRDL